MMPYNIIVSTDGMAGPCGQGMQRAERWLTGGDFCYDRLPVQGRLRGLAVYSVAKGTVRGMFKNKKPRSIPLFSGRQACRVRRGSASAKGL